MILLLNGAFGIGKTTVAQMLVARCPGSLLFNPEVAGMVLQRSARLAGHVVEDFQDFRLWRLLTVWGLRLARLRSSAIVVPMAISNPWYLSQLRDAIGRFEPHLYHACLTAPVDVVHARLYGRGDARETHEWEYRRASECCAVHGGEAFAIHVDATERAPESLADAIIEHGLFPASLTDPAV